jgi:beta-phosphoglucomutase-like phosphatase (HAD superfamily)
MKYIAVLFDCDGVLVDSEHITNTVLRDMLHERGWVLSLQECMQHFVGRLITDNAALIEKHTGQPLTPEWVAAFRERRNQALARDLGPVAGAVHAVQSIHARYGARIACASGADRGKVELQLGKVGLMPYFEGRIFSGVEMPRSKPAPDVYLAAAKALAVDPSHCAVVEDTVAGATAGLHAGCTVLAYCPPQAGAANARLLRKLGVHSVFESMADLPALVV